MRATACMVACAPPQASVLFCRRRLGIYHSQPLLGGRKKPKNATHGTATAMQLSSKSCAILCVFGRLAWLSWHLADRAGGKIGLATAIIVSEAPPPGYAVL